MFLTDLKLSNFRNYYHMELELSPQVNIQNGGGIIGTGIIGTVTNGTSIRLKLH